MYLYEYHLDGWYIEEEYKECEICEQCGDSDSYMFEFNDPEEFYEGILENGIETNINLVNILKNLSDDIDIESYAEYIINTKQKEIKQLKELINKE